MFCIGLALPALGATSTATMARRPAPGPMPRLHLKMTYDGDPAVCRPVQKLVSRAINRYEGMPSVSHYDEDQVFSGYYARYRPPQIVVPKPDILGGDTPFNPVGGTQQEAFRLNTGEDVGGGSIALIMHELWHGVYYGNIYILRKGAVIPPVGHEPDPKDIVFALGERKYSGERMPYLLTRLLDLPKISHLKDHQSGEIHYTGQTMELFLDRIYTAEIFKIKRISGVFLFLGSPRFGRSAVFQINDNGIMRDVCYFNSGLLSKNRHGDP
jgi:hypothetical protein